MAISKSCESQGSRAKILLAAKELFYEVGYQSTSVDDILRKSGVAKSNFYYHFKTKEELGFAVLEERFAEHEANAMRFFQCPTLSPSEQLARFFENVCEIQSRLPTTAGCPFGNFAATLACSSGHESDERFRQQLSRFFARLEDTLRRCIMEGIERGEFRGDISANEAAELIEATIQGGLILAKTHQNPALLKRSFMLLLQLLRS